MKRSRIVPNLPLCMVVLLLALLSFSATSAQDAGVQVTFVVDGTVTDYTPLDVRATAEVIARRFVALGLTDYRVQILDGRAIQVQFTT